MMKSPKKLKRPCKKYDLATMPLEILENVFDFLSLGDLLRVSRTSTRMYSCTLRHILQLKSIVYSPASPDSIPFTELRDSTFIEYLIRRQLVNCSVADYTALLMKDFRKWRWIGEEKLYIPPSPADAFVMYPKKFVQHAVQHFEYNDAIEILERVPVSSYNLYVHLTTNHMLLAWMSDQMNPTLNPRTAVMNAVMAENIPRLEIMFSKNRAERIRNPKAPKFITSSFIRFAKEQKCYDVLEWIKTKSEDIDSMTKELAKRFNL